MNWDTPPELPDLRTYGDKPYPYRGALKPPPEIWDEMNEAGRLGDDVRLGLARARYTAWLRDQGYER